MTEGEAEKIISKLVRFYMGEIMKVMPSANPVKARKILLEEIARELKS